MATRIIKGITQKRYKIIYPCENSSICHPIQLFINKGTYKIELWGAGNQGGGGGCYTSGEVHFYDKTCLFFYLLEAKDKAQAIQ